jgi:CheY-like chemotaxis protein/two-component sensor histidine kinase
MVHRNIELEARLIDDLLDVNAMHRGTPLLELKKVDFHRAVLDTLDILRSAIMSRRHQLNVQLDAEEHFVMADYSRIQQIIWNLLANAVKFTPQKGEISVRSYNRGHLVVLEIIDTGIGISPEVLPRIFEEFAQGHERSLFSSSGLGLGLAISKRLVDLHGGQLTASSSGKGLGTTFTLEFMAAVPPKPVPSPSPTTDGELGEQLHTRVEETVEGGRPTTLNLLLVEDDENTIEVLTRLLRRAGHHVTPARSVHAALAAADVGTFDLLVSDIGLPDGSGYDLMRQLKSRFNLPGIAISGFGMDQDVRRSQEVGFSAHVTKPLDVQRLKRVMSEVSLGERRNGQKASGRG